MEQTTVGGGRDRGGGNCPLLSEMKQEPLQLRKGTLQEAINALRARQDPLGGLTQGGSRGKARFPFTSQPRTDIQASPSGSPSFKQKSRLETGAQKEEKLPRVKPKLCSVSQERKGERNAQRRGPPWWLNGQLQSPPTPAPRAHQAPRGQLLQGIEAPRKAQLFQPIRNLGNSPEVQWLTQPTAPGFNPWSGKLKKEKEVHSARLCE